MKQIEQNTILTSTPLFLADHMGPVAAQSGLSAKIMSAIYEGSALLNKPSPLEPWIPQKYCSYPNQPRMDEFNLKEGLGEITLQPIIDGLNQFKQNCIQAIKTKLQSMGPDGSRDAKLAKGVAETIQQVYTAAKCFTQTIQNITALINTYISVIDYVVVEVVAKLNQLEDQILTIQKMFDPVQLDIELLGIISIELLKDIYISDIFSLLGKIDALLNQIGNLQTATHNLKRSPERALLHLEADLDVLRGAVVNFKYFTEMLGIANSNRTSGLILRGQITDNFLDDFDYGANTESGDYNWSVTNSGGLLEYNSDDDRDILKKLTNMCHSYIQNTSPVIIIDSRTVSGTIVVPGDGDGILSGGLDPSIGNKFGFLFDLNINNGETIIQTNITGIPATDGSLVNKTIGSFLTTGSNSFSYKKVVQNTDGTFNLYLTNSSDANHIDIGGWYQSVNINITSKTTIDSSGNVQTDSTSDINPWFTSANGYNVNNGSTVYNDLPGSGWDLILQNTSTLIKSYVPMVFKVIDVNTVFVTIQLLQPNIDFYPNQFISDINHVFIQDDNGNYNPQNKPPIDPLETTIFTMNKYIAATEENKPQAGQKISCKNWVLSIQPYSIKDMTNIVGVRNISFTRVNPSDVMKIIFLKCKFGFIPDAS